MFVVFAYGVIGVKHYSFGLFDLIIVFVGVFV